MTPCPNLNEGPLKRDSDLPVPQHSPSLPHHGDPRTWTKEVFFNTPAGTRVKALFPPVLANGRITHLFIYLTNSSALSMPRPQLDIARSWEKCWTLTLLWWAQTRSFHDKENRKPTTVTSTTVVILVHKIEMLWGNAAFRVGLIQQLDPKRLLFGLSDSAFFPKFMVSTWLPIFPVST